jgi:hypothetical protein
MPKPSTVQQPEPVLSTPHPQTAHFPQMYLINCLLADPKCSAPPTVNDDPNFIKEPYILIFGVEIAQ